VPDEGGAGADRLRSLKRDVLALTPGYVIPGVATLVSVPVLFHLLGAAQYGVYVLIFALANGVPLITSSWLEEITIRYGHRREARLGPAYLAVSIASSIVIGASLSSILIPTATTELVVVTAVSTASVGAYLVAVARLQAALRFGMIGLLASARAVLGTVLAIAIAAATTDPASTSVGLAISFACAAAIGLAARGRRALAVKASGERSRGDGFLGYGLASTVGAVALYFLSIGDRFVLSNARTLAEAGSYSAIYGIIDLGFRLVPAIVLAPIRPRVFRAWDSGDGQRAVRLLASYSAILTWILSGIVLLVVAGGQAFPIVALEPSIAGPVALGLALFVVGYGLGLLLSAQFRQARLGGHLVLAATVNLVLNLLLVPQYGATAAALTTATSYAAYFVLNATSLRSQGLLEHVTAVRLTGASIFAAVVGVLAAEVGHGGIGALAGAGVLLLCSPLVQATLRGAPEILAAFRLQPAAPDDRETYKAGG
jgi:O-antigen/teichoic acid export membrane protein